mmetsp:Transcript_34893/g.42096  ORF Transcript_34893/g.42096 Transcript_34893/m.42096 type:complete len:144 (+) Transcript_34893:178-609(+)|eukprot:CAMPEP_0194383958 /NCGR_PEP_ID=MMETSP0174-20130528/70989_1 /TAXON_ID=216777 /ORGANISM="Proboscia alata, Strain PI-D3" /LENGTH=143 /DNA_ID=CAMNT_0039170691 /DNA_START=38 /DNA_END=469 /DNA_ORIENTATION=-
MKFGVQLLVSYTNSYLGNKIILAPGFDRYALHETNENKSDITSGEHEAAYDAFMTGSIFHIFANNPDYIPNNANVLYGMQSIYNFKLDCAQYDPLKSGLDSRSICIVYGFELTVKNFDIFQALKPIIPRNIESDYSQRNYDII